MIQTLIGVTLMLNIFDTKSTTENKNLRTIEIKSTKS